jgi:hypothetical protein
VNPTTKTGLQLVIAGVGCALLYISPVPLPLLSVSQGLPCLRELRGRNSLQLSLHARKVAAGKNNAALDKRYTTNCGKKVLYPVHKAFVQVRAAIDNATLATPTLHQKVHDAIYRSFQARLVWKCATAGVVFQLLLSKPSQSIVSALSSWWLVDY